MINSLVHGLLLPPAGLFLLFALGLIIGHRYPGPGRVLKNGAVATLFLLSTGLGSMALVYPLEHLDRVAILSDSGDAQAIVVLAAGHYAPAPEYGSTSIPDYVALARLRYASHLHRKTNLPILISGGNGDVNGAYGAMAESMASALREDFSVPVKWAETQSSTTAENAKFTARILKEENISTILLVTDAMHMSRSILSFEANGLKVIPAPTIFFSNRKLSWSSLLPSAESLRRSYYATYEWLGLIWYSISLPDTQDYEKNVLQKG